MFIRAACIQGYYFVWLFLVQLTLKITMTQMKLKLTFSIIMYCLNMYYYRSNVKRDTTKADNDLRFFSDKNITPITSKHLILLAFSLRHGAVWLDCTLHADYQWTVIYFFQCYDSRALV